MTDDIKKKAEEWANTRCPNMDATDIVWSMCFDDFMAGAKYANETPHITRQFVIPDHALVALDDYTLIPFGKLKEFYLKHKEALKES